MKRLMMTGIVLVVVLGGVFGVRVAVQGLGGSSLSDDVPPVSRWTTVTVGDFTFKLPDKPARSTKTSGAITTTLVALGADDDNLLLNIVQSPQATTAGAAVENAAKGSRLSIRAQAPATVGGQPGETYRLEGTAGGQTVTAFGAAVVHGDMTVVMQYGVGGSRTTAPKLFQQVLDTFAFTS